MMSLTGRAVLIRQRAVWQLGGATGNYRSLCLFNMTEKKKHRLHLLSVWWHTDQNTNIYITLYRCVCVCVCVCFRSLAVFKVSFFLTVHWLMMSFDTRFLQTHLASLDGCLSLWVTLVVLRFLFVIKCQIGKTLSVDNIFKNMNIKTDMKHIRWSLR